MKPKQKIQQFLAIGLAGVGLVTALVAVNDGYFKASIFKDVPLEHANEEAIAYVREQGFVNGYDDGTYRPDNTINRAEFTKIIVEAVWTGEAAGANCFSDVKTVEGRDDWFARYVCYAKEKGVIGGYPDGTFRPEKNVSFVEAAKIVVLAFDYGTTPSEPWYKPYVEELGFRRSIPFTIEDFGKEITRGEMAEMIYRLKAEVVTKNSLEYMDIVSIGKMKDYPCQYPCTADTKQAVINNYLDGIALAQERSNEIARGAHKEERAKQSDEVVEAEGSNDVSDNAVVTVAAGSVGTSPYFGNPCVRNADATLAHQLVSPDDVSGIVPLGSIDMGYIFPWTYITLPAQKKVPFYAPVDSELIMGSHFWGNPEKTYSQYLMIFQKSCEVIYKLTNLTEVSDAIKVAFPGEPSENSGGKMVTNKVKVKAGDLIGYAVGENYSRGIVFGLFNSTVKNVFATPAKYAQSWDAPYGICPYDYFEKSLKDRYYAKFVDEAGQPLADKNCGSVSKDVAGTLAGAWFASKDGKYMDISQRALAVGLGIGGKAVKISRPGVHASTVSSGDSTFKNPAEVTIEHCYVGGLGGGIAYFKLVSATELEGYFDQQMASCPSSFPTSGTVKFYR